MADKLVIKNVSIMLSGALEAPILDADTVVVVDEAEATEEGSRTRAALRLLIITASILGCLVLV